MSIATYDPSEVDIYLAILHQVTGFSPDSLISISRDENYFESFHGGSGKVERMTVPNNTCTIEIHLSQTSPSNTTLNALATLDHLTGIGIFPIFAKDASGNSLFVAPSCWIEKPAEATYEKDIVERVWIIKCAEMVFGIGGNGDTGTLNRITQLGTMIGQAGGNMGIF